MDERLAYAALGATAAFVGTTCVALPFVVLLSTLSGSDTSIAIDLWYAFIGSVALSPIAMVVGGAAATVLRGRRLHKRTVVRCIAVGAGVTVAVGAIGIISLEAGGVWIASAVGVFAGLGALGALASLGVYQLVRRRRVWQLVMARLRVPNSALTA